MSEDLIFRLAQEKDLERIVAIFGEDEFGRDNENLQLPVSKRYIEALENIQGSKAARVIVAEYAGEVLGVMQMIVIQHLNGHGQKSLLLGSVHVSAQRRGGGIGAKMMAHAEEIAQQEGCALIQLTTNKKRIRAHKFYERLGFASSHEGMKKKL